MTAAHYCIDARTATPHFLGIGRYVVSLLGAMWPLLDGDQLSIVVRPESREAVRSALETIDSTEAGNVNLVDLGCGPLSISQQVRIPATVRRLGCSLYHSPYYSMPYRTGIPTVLTVYDLIPWAVDGASALQTRVLFWALSRLAIASADAIVAISEATKRDYVSLFKVDPAKIVVVPLGVARVFSRCDEATISTVRVRLGLPKRFALYVGSNRPHKNLVRLVLAWQSGDALQADLPPLVIAGPWDSRYPDARRLVQNAGLSRRVKLVGRRPDTELAALYSGCEYLVLPSLAEGFGLTAVEAMACGAPVVCSTAPGLAEVTGDAALSFDPRSTRSILGAVARMSSDGYLRASLSARGLDRAGLFTWERAARSTLDVYRELARGRARKKQ